ncbi:DNA/RNA non-specific endonuclease [Streptomyces sp. NPDC091215]|uniref:DNA/RNA non-specific endonuclease n=1 Tax=Streptomyces sp. NPDC091215 TaxID=3155192 RepID=UPI00343854C2
MDAYNKQFDDPRSSGDCQTTRKTWVCCQPLDAEGRATGAQACLNESDINFNPSGRTTDFDPAKKTFIVGSDTVRGKNPVNPPGYRKGLARGHLLGYQLGGDGGDERNMVPMYNDANSRVMMRTPPTRCPRRLTSLPWERAASRGHGRFPTSRSPSGRVRIVE